MKKLSGEGLHTLTLDQLRLAVSLTVGKLKVVVERLFKVKQAKQALFLQVSHDDPCPENIGDQEDRELYYFGIQVVHNIHGVVLQHRQGSPPDACRLVISCHQLLCDYVTALQLHSAAAMLSLSFSCRLDLQ